MKIIVDDKVPFIRGHIEKLAQEVIYLPGSQIAPEDVKDADALIVRTRTHCNRQLLEGSRVQFIVTATIGYDHLDTAYLDEVGIQWANCPGCNATSVAQYVRNSLFEAEQHGLIRLCEATLGIVGYGHVGKAVYAALSPYVREILVNDPPLFEGTTEKSHRVHPLENMSCASRCIQEGAPTIATLSALSQCCDIITLHTPLTHHAPFPTFHLIDDTFLHQVKKRPILINAARGGVVDEAALGRALDEGRIRQAIIDTWEGEPHINSQLLERAFIATPHIAGYSADGKANATRMALEALADFVGVPHTFIISDIDVPRASPERTGLRYNPLTDSEWLKERPEQFEYLRGNYPIRRE